MQGIKQFSNELLYPSIFGFWSGWLGGSLVLAGGKVWALITSPELKVSERLGHIGTPTFRRELAVGLTVYFLTQKLFQKLAEKIIPSYHKEKVKILSSAIAVAIASLAASAVTHLNYRYLLYPMCMLSIAHIANVIFFNHPTSEEDHKK